jgi:uncharacterized protein
VIAVERHDLGSIKDTENQLKHGVSFADAQHAFFDLNRVIAQDVSHSTPDETRYYCFGERSDGILTVRLTWRGETIRIIGAGPGQADADPGLAHHALSAPGFST